MATQRVCVHGAAIVTASDIDKGAIANDKWSASRIRQRGLYRPAGSQLFVVIDWGTRGIVCPGRNDTVMVNRCTVEQQPSYVHGRPSRPVVGSRVVVLRRGGLS